MSENSQNIAEGVPKIKSLENGNNLVEWHIVAKTDFEEDSLSALSERLSINSIEARCLKIGVAELLCKYEFPFDLRHEVYWETSMRNLLVIEEGIGGLVSIENRPRKNWKLRLLVVDRERTCDLDMTGLMIAAKYPDSDELRKFIMDLSKEEVNAKTPSGKTALHYAIEAGIIENVEILLGAGAEINVPGEVTPIQHAVQDLLMVKKLASAGADLNFTDKYGGTALMTAAAFGLTELVSWLLINGAKEYTVNAFGENALDIAKSNRREEVVKLLS